MLEIEIAPSILSADFAVLAEEVRAVEAGGADLIHIDVMDGHFVPNLTFGSLIVKAVRKTSNLPLDVHLMVENPDALIPDFTAAGANLISVHAEACVHLHRTIASIRDAGLKAGVVINPATPVVCIEPVLYMTDFVLIMTINPGFGGQRFIPQTLEKIRELRGKLDAQGRAHVPIEVDGGINSQTAPQAVQAGATRLVAGTAVFGEADRTAAIRRLREAAMH